MSKNVSQQFRFKVAICGDWAVGKTSLVRRFATDTFTHDYLTTIAVNHVTKKLKIQGINIDLQIWDTGGQERFSQLRRRYYKASDGVIFVFDLTRPESFRHIEKRWVPEVNGILEDYVPTIWGAKSDLVDQRVVSQNSGRRLAREMNAYYFETSALTGENVEEAFSSLTKLILSKAFSTAKQKTSFTV
jgi:small GTP-binding protein